MCLYVRDGYVLLCCGRVCVVLGDGCVFVC